MNISINSNSSVKVYGYLWTFVLPTLEEVEVVLRNTYLKVDLDFPFDFLGLIHDNVELEGTVTGNFLTTAQNAKLRRILQRFGLGYT
jgi:hypothetical protein